MIPLTLLTLSLLIAFLLLKKQDAGETIIKTTGALILLSLLTWLTTLALSFRSPASRIDYSIYQIEAYGLAQAIITSMPDGGTLIIAPPAEPSKILQKISANRLRGLTDTLDPTLYTIDIATNLAQTDNDLYSPHNMSQQRFDDLINQYPDANALISFTALPPLTNEDPSSIPAIYLGLILNQTIAASYLKSHLIQGYLQNKPYTETPQSKRAPPKKRFDNKYTWVTNKR